ncbi:MULTISPECIES: spore germination protein GerW family protein [unclassified Streptosporangium]|uniref:spore germination protein GerW family protein n=1 Tax=unclassified Streptosporangium TaxID=2632669 RepID=UPI002E2E1B63|nr:MULTISPECIES: spore germination protein GerW family protein [unclassified Streptosporangium]
MEMIEQAKDTVSIRRVFGEPIVQDGMTIIPVARVTGGGGGGGGNQKGERPSEGTGGGFGFGVTATGVFVIKDSEVRWQPVVDVNRIVLGGQIVLVAALLTVRSIARARARAAKKR